MSQDALTGGCFCGRIRYAVTATPRKATLCHCADCRRIAGAPAVAWFSVDRSGFRVTGGTPKRFRSSDRAARSFCPDCGTPFLFEEDGSHEIDVSTATLDDPNQVPPVDHSWAQSLVVWDHLSPDIPVRAAQGQNATRSPPLPA